MTTQSALLAAILAEADAAAETGLDMNEVVSGGGQGSRLLPQGYALVRLVEYTEFGNQPQEFKGVAKDPAQEVQLGFALYGAVPGSDETYHSIGEGGVLVPYILRLFPFALKQNDGARSHLLFKLLNWDGKAKNFGQLLGKAWVVKVVHEPKSKADQTLVSRLDITTFLPPLDPVTQQPYNIPMPEDKYFRIFLWDRPTKAGWDALYIEPTAKVKNFVQDKIMSATNFEGSPLQQLLGGAATLALPGAAAPLTTAVTAPVNQAASPAASSAPAVAVTPVQPQAIVQPATAVVVPATAVVEPAQAVAAVAPLAQPAAVPVQLVAVPVTPVVPSVAIPPATPV